MSSKLISKEARIFNGEKTTPSINGVGKIESLHAKEQTGYAYNSLQTNLKIKNLSISGFVKP